jgi:eukaryotic-like serine/threonine-protein kinase
MSQSSATFAPGQRLGSYELLLELASGGTATVGIAVYRGAAGFERLVVVKRMHRNLTRDPDFTAMLLDEARLASSVRHPNVVPVIDVVRADDEVALVMDYVESVTMSELLRAAEATGKRVPIPIVSRIVTDVLTGLHEAHDAVDIRGQTLGIVHRDVSPQNLIVGADGISRVIDFGVAKARNRLARTQAGIVKGKCAYMAPEQVDGQPVDRRCDLFAAGIVLWEALTGRRLFRAGDEFDEMRLVMSAPIPGPSTLAQECTPEVDALLATALARPVGTRFQTALAFAQALERAIPPAPPRLVAQYVGATCRTELEYRRARLTAILGNEVAKLSSPASWSSPKVESAAADPAARGGTRKMVPALEPPQPRGSPKRSLAPMLLGVTIVVVGVGGALVWLSRVSGGISAATATATATPTPTPTATATATPTPTATTTTTPTTTAIPLPTPLRGSTSLRPPSPPAPTAELKRNPYGP